MYALVAFNLPFSRHLRFLMADLLVERFSVFIHGTFSTLLTQLLIIMMYVQSKLNEMGFGCIGVLGFWDGFLRAGERGCNLNI